MKFLRRTAHVVSIVVLLCVGGPCAFALSQDPRTKQNQSADKDQATAKELATISSELSKINARETQRDEQRTKQEANHGWRDGFAPNTWSNWGVASFALLTFIAALLTLNALRCEVRATTIAANAAKSSAETATKALRLALIPIIEITPSPEDGGFFLFSTSPDQQRFTYALRLHLTNVGTVPARVLRIDLVYQIANEPDSSVSSQGGFTLGSDRLHETDLLIDISQATRDVLSREGVIIRADIILQLHHPIDGPFWHTYELTLSQFGARRTMLQDHSDYDGYRRDKSQSKDEP